MAMPARLDGVDGTGGGRWRALYCGIVLPFKLLLPCLAARCPDHVDSVTQHPSSACALLPHSPLPRGRV